MKTVVSVRFRGGCKEYDFDPNGLNIEEGRDVIVETAQGPEYVWCTRGNHDIEDDAVVEPLRPVLRLATENDRRTLQYNQEREKDAYSVCQKKIAQHGLDMKLVRVECSFDGAKLLFFFTADGRVDFRELVKDLAGVFRARIELRQIGVRDEAKMVGGLGICGRPFCCNSYLDEFVPVSIKMAKTQNLSLNPTKISGTCGRLMCCLKYEQDAYEDAIRRMPKNESFVMTPDGAGNVSEVNLLKETVKVRLDESPNEAKTYRNCEVCVLRNGKGSRDGIDVNVKRPARYVEPVEEEMPLLRDYMAVHDQPAEDVPAENEERSSRRRSRNRRRGGDRAAKAEAPKVEKQDLPAEKKERSLTERTSRRRRGPRGGEKKAGAPKAEGTKPNAAKPNGPKTEAPKTAAPNPGGPAKTEAGAAKKPRHRGGRRHRGGKKPTGGEA